MSLETCNQQQQPALMTSSMTYPTNFSSMMSAVDKPTRLKLDSVRPVAAPPGAKVRLIARVSGVEPGVDTCLRVDKSRHQVVLHEPSPHLASSLQRQRSVSIGPKLFQFDEVFAPEDSLRSVCESSLSDVLQSVVSGSDGCVFTFGAARVGKTYTTIGMDDSPSDVGLIPSAISWLYQLIEAEKLRSGARFSVRVSAVELTGRQEQLRDLLLTHSNSHGAEGASCSPGVYLREDVVSGMSYLDNQCEVRAATADVAAHLLDAAIASRTVPATDEDSRHSHLLFTLSVYQYRVQSTSSHGQNNVVGGRSQLHLLDLGSCSSHSRTGDAAMTLSLTSLGAVITSLLSGQRQLPHRDRKLTQLLRQSLGGATCSTCALVHLSPAEGAYSDTLQVLQLASRMHQTRLRRRPKYSSSSDESSCDGTSQHWYGRRRAGVRMGVRHRYHQSSLSDPECQSSSEQSCDTAIFLGPSGSRPGSRAPLSDRELTDSETASSVITVHSAQQPRHSQTPSQNCSPYNSHNAAVTSSSSRDLPDRKPNSPVAAATAADAAVATSSPRRRFPRVSASPRCPATIPEHPDEELWVDGPRSTVCRVPPSLPERKPNSSQKCSSQSTTPADRELWVDGPVEFRTKISRTGGLAKKPVVKDGEVVEQAVTSCRQPQRTEGGSKSRLPRSNSASKNRSSSSRSRQQHHPSPPAVDGRVSAWVKSVQLATSQQPTADMDDLSNLDVSESQEVEPPSSLEGLESLSRSVEGDKDEADSMVTSSHSLYERQVDESLETGSLCRIAVSSDDDAGSVSNSKTDRLRDGVPDGCTEEKQYDESQVHSVTNKNIPSMKKPGPEVSSFPIKSSSRDTTFRSQPVDPLVRSTSNCSRITTTRSSSTSPSPRCLFTHRQKSSSVGSQSPQPSRLRSPNPRSCTPTGTRRSSDAAGDKIMKKPVFEQVKDSGVSSQQKKSGSLRSQQSKKTSSPRTGRVDRKSGLPVAVKQTGSVASASCLVSPYHTVTSPRPRVAGCSTSSDNSSQITARSKSSELELSSGYESMLRDDSEETIAPHCTDWTTSDRHHEQADEPGSCDLAPSQHHHAMLPIISERTSPSVPGSGSEAGVWIHCGSSNDLPTESVDANRRPDHRLVDNATDVHTMLARIHRVDELLLQQTELKSQLHQLKHLLSTTPATASCCKGEPVDLTSDRDRADPDYLRTLELETCQLERRVRACQARIMLVTCFDSRL